MTFLLILPEMTMIQVVLSDVLNEPGYSYRMQCELLGRELSLQGTEENIERLPLSPVEKLGVIETKGNTRSRDKDGRRPYSDALDSDHTY